ncbi:TPA: hypothetical protein MYM89_000876 [Klebsiella pneumoniae]|uniref:hypothetical protein n=1 Tax=Klebsiella pneumoniae TaxID=573 RepID=UPI00050C1F89|nr:hypothetical protein [Klebsiella pneumoniae]HBS1663567.1 hypothetical protein [Klebsiella quasipneumoniae subsp. quasipneumoniae]HCB0383938.1 hypothetical protein [Klebsiella pneumoniae]
MTAQEKSADLFTIDPTSISQGGKKAKYRDNVVTIRLLKELEIGNRQTTVDKQAVLAQYVAGAAFRKRLPTRMVRPPAAGRRKSPS